jgi:hypothetical protein
MAKAAFNKKKALFTSKWDKLLRKKLVELYIWNIYIFFVLELGRIGK